MLIILVSGILSTIGSCSSFTTVFKGAQTIYEDPATTASTTAPWDSATIHFTSEGINTPSKRSIDKCLFMGNQQCIVFTHFGGTAGTATLFDRYCNVQGYLTNIPQTGVVSMGTNNTDLGSLNFMHKNGPVFSFQIWNSIGPWITPDSVVDCDKTDCRKSFGCQPYYGPGGF